MSFPVYNPAPMIERYRRFEALERGEQREQQRFEALERNRQQQAEHQQIQRDRQRQEAIRNFALKALQADPTMNLDNLLPHDSNIETRKQMGEIQKGLKKQLKQKESSAEAERLGTLASTLPQGGGAGTPTGGVVARGREAAGAFPAQQRAINQFEALGRAKGAGRLPPDVWSELQRRTQAQEQEAALGRTGEMVPVYDTSTSPPTLMGMRDLDLPEVRRELKQNPNLLATRTLAQGTLRDLSPIGRPEQRLATKQVSEMAGRIVDLASLKREMQRVGEGAVGYRGFITNYIAGPVWQLNHSLGDKIADIVSGARPEEVAEVEIQAKSMVSDLIPQLAAEETGRVTQFELQRTERVSRLSSPSASFTQVLASIDELTTLAILTQHRRAVDAGLPVDDVRTLEGRKKIAIRLEKLGAPARKIVRVLEDLTLLQDELERTGIQPPPAAGRR